MDDERFASLRALTREQAWFEAKAGGPRTDRHLFARVVRAMIAMANRQDGGIIVLGIDDLGGNLGWNGMTSTDRDTWRHDDVADAVANYVDPSITFELLTHDDSGLHFLVVEVAEFADVPVLCKRDYPDVLRGGACYVRTRRKPESSEIPTQSEMRDLLDLAVEKRLSRLFGTLDRSGLSAVPTATSSDEFRRQLDGFV